MKKKALACILVLVLMLVMVVGCGNQQAAPKETNTATNTPTTTPAPAKKVPGVTADTITVGGIADLTGPVAPQATIYKQGIADYIQWTNDNGGVNGRKIVIKWEDDQWKTDKAVAAFRKLVGEGIFALVAENGSTQWAALDPEIREEKIPVIGPGQTTIQQAENPYCFNVLMDYGDQTVLMVDRAVADFKGTGKPKLAVFAPEGASAQEFINGVKKQASKVGATVVVEQIISYSVSEMAGPLTKVKQAGADALLMLANAYMENIYLRDAARLGMSNMQTITAATAIFPSIWEQAGKEASKNFIAVSSQSPMYLDGPGLALERQIAAKYNTNPNMTSTFSYPLGVAGAMVFVEALKRAGKDLTREGLINALENMKDFDMGGVSGNVTYTKDSHNGVHTGRFYTYDFDKKLVVPISDWITVKAEGGPTVKR